MTLQTKKSDRLISDILGLADFSINSFFSAMIAKIFAILTKINTIINYQLVGPSSALFQEETHILCTVLQPAIETQTLHLIHIL